MAKVGFYLEPGGVILLSRISQCNSLARVITEKQFILDFIPEVYFRNEKYYSEGNLVCRNTNTPARLWLWRK